MNMKKMRKSVVAAMMLLGLVVAPVAASISLADDPPAAGNAGLTDSATVGAVMEEKKSSG